MTPEELRLRVGEVEIVDVREPVEWDAGHLPGSRHVPLGSLDRYQPEDPTRPIVVVCRSGNRSDLARLLLRARGFDADHLDGGLVAWVRAGGPLVGSDGGPGTVI